RRACQQLPSISWSEDVIAQYESDRKFLNDEYAKARPQGFSVASDMAHVQLYLRCSAEQIQCVAQLSAIRAALERRKEMASCENPETVSMTTANWQLRLDIEAILGEG
ncbi:MAG TPA: hypothetical protein DCS09_08845, partial [Porphyromonadaceae bacterium]|nr:hypothetical protein [Porphyromonadaceae bacterium]